MKKTVMNRIFSLFLVLALLVAMTPHIQAVELAQPKNWKESSPSVSPDLSDRLAQLHLEDQFADTDIVRVAIVLEEKSTIEAGFSTMDIANDVQAMAYNQNLQKKQETMEQTISRVALGGEALDVVWNLTLVGNIISANVPFGKIDAIRQVPGVAGVVLENMYEPCEVDRPQPVTPDQYIATGMTGSNLVWTNGYTGAGSRIAVIDTGTDTDHQSFDNGAFLYALEQNAANAGMTLEDYMASLDMLDEEELAEVLPNLNIYERDNTLTAEALYLNEKLAYAVNYVDKGADRLLVDHDHDYQGPHGSHVAGISTANRFIPRNGGYVDAMTAVQVAGVAPDAQLITMKVFGNSALRDSDYMAAVEDAILLGCDSVNLSLGTVVPGFAFSTYFAELLDFMAETDTVVVASAGNEGTWSDMTMFGTPYSDDVVYGAVGSPGSYHNFFTVASVENDGVVGMIFTVGDLSVMYVENLDYGNNPLASIDTTADGSGTTYEYIFTDSLGKESDYNGMDLTGKIVFCSRGETNFADKANIAISKGAVAVIVYNNQPGDFGMNLTGYSYTNPAVSISQEVANEIRNMSTAQTTEAGVTYYTGTIDIFGAPQAGLFHSAYYTMSTFSSWGVPSDLTLKPEITAPGGMIYSVYGSYPELQGTDQYGLMSGTSMAAPQVSGMVALLAQYMRENGLSEHTGISPRVLAQSLLMSTATPMKEQYSDSYYPLMQQGAGLARVDLATLAESYIMVAGQSDGKVKAELGDDPARTGVYEFTFTIHNMTNEAQAYALRAEMFRQGVYDPGEYYYGTPYEFTVQDTTTVALASNAVFMIDGVVVDDVANVPAGGSATVQVQLALTEQAKAELDAQMVDGAFVQAYVFAEEMVEDGTQGTNHSIPVLAFYGNWTDPNMFDRGTYIEMMYGISDLIPYMYQVIGNGNALTIDYGDGVEYYFGGNPFLTDDAYMAERNAFNSEDASFLKGQYFTLIRNAGELRLQIVNKETGEVYYTDTEIDVYPAFFNSGINAWDSVQQGMRMNWTGTDANGNPLPENTVVQVVLTAVPEYYRQADGTYDYSSLGYGASLVTEMTIDNTAPELQNFVLDAETSTQLTITALDNQYVAAAFLMNKTGTIALASAAANQTTANTEVQMQMDLTGVTGETFQLVIYDYAGNASAYEIQLDLPEIERPYFTAIDYGAGIYYGINADGSYISLGASDRGAIMAAEFVDGYVFEISDGDKLYVAQDSDLNFFEYLGDLDPYGEYAITNFLELAFNYADGKLYGLFYSELNSEMYPYLCTIDMLNCRMEVLGSLAVDVNSMTIDDAGNFYSVTYGYPSLYTYTLDQAFSGGWTYIGEIGYYGTGSFNSMAWDHDQDKLYWAYPNTLLEINTETAEPTLLSYFGFNMVGLYIRPENYTGDMFAPVDEIISLELDYTENRTMVGTKVLLTATIRPWNVSDKSVTWTSADESIATVDERGMVTGVSVGTTVITATSNLDPTMTASCTIEVVTLDKTLNGLVWDEDGRIWWSEFNVNGLPNYIKLQDTPVEEYLAATAVTPDGTIYATTTDISTGYLESKLFTVDPESLALTEIGDVATEEYTIGLSDIAYAPNMLGGSIMGTYGSALVIVDPATGAYRGDYTMFSYGLNAIAYVGSDRYQEWGFDTYIDWFFLIDTHGFVYLMGFLTDDNGALYYLEHPATNGGIFTVVDYVTDVIYFGSAHYDGEYLYWSVYNESEDVSTLFAIDTQGSRKYYKMGDFGTGVWPVGGLMEMPGEHAHTHTFGEWEVFNPATCTEEGEERRYCACGEFESRIVEATGHKFVDGACENCGEIDPRPVVTVGSVDAQPGEEVTVEVSISATTLAGYGLKVIYDAEALEITKISKGEDAGEGFFSGSKKTGKVTYANTYNEEVEGVLFTITFKVLTYGQHTVSLEIDSFGLDDQTTIEVRAVDGVINAEEPHTCVYGEWEVYTPATCTEDGEERRYCECGEYESRVIEATGHSFGEWTVETPATCTENGEERRYCECGEYESRVIEATGHTYGEWTVETPATCTENGEERRYCECGEYESRVIEATGHTFGEWTVETPATCTENGEERRYCECGEYESRVIEATGHSFGEWTVETPATCTENGEERRYCECGEYESRVIEATGHSFGEWTVETPATCTEDGVEKRTCACGETETRVIEATGHSYVDGVCEHCGQEDSSNPPTGSANILAVIALAAMSVTAGVVITKRKSEE